LGWGFRRQARRVEELILKHLELVTATVSKFREALSAYLDAQDLTAAERLAEETHRLESQADDVRREAAMKLVSGALLPAMRGELLELLERTDKVANLSESLLYFLLLQKLEIPAEVRKAAHEIAHKTSEMMAEAGEAIHALFRDREAAIAKAEKVEQLESEVDQLELQAVRQLFALNLDLAEKILVREFINRLADISDKIEDLSDQVEIIVANRRV